MVEKLSSTGESAPQIGELIDEISKTDVVVYEKLNASNDKEAKQEFLEDESLEHPNN